jgi:hypothetical protein
MASGWQVTEMDGHQPDTIGIVGVSKESTRERYIFMWKIDDTDVLLETLGRFAQRSDLSFNEKDAEQLREHVIRQRDIVLRQRSHRHSDHDLSGPRA